jgi:outer membrane lipoprotein-sorting protein
MRLPRNFSRAIVAAAAVSSIFPFVGVSAEDSQLGNDAKDGGPFFDNLWNSSGKLDTYSFHSTLQTYKDNKTKMADGNVTFRKQHCIRIEVTQPGMKYGSVLVKQPDGQIKAQGGPKMFGLKMTINPDSRMLVAPNGFNVVNSDFASLYSHIKDLRSSGHKLLVSSNPVSTTSAGRAEVMEIISPDSGVVERIYVNPQTKTPVEWDIFKEGRLFSTLRISNFKDEAALNDDLFKL